MISSLVKKLVGSRNDRLLNKYRTVVKSINEQESAMTVLSDEQLKAKTEEFKQRLTSGTKLKHLLPEAFAVVREAARRVYNMRHFDVQLIGGMVLHDGKIAEMRTGEGKTLVATLPVYLNALAGNGVHVITVNDYLAKRDAEMMGRIFGFLGLTTGCNLSGMDHQTKQAAYAADITYGTNNEFGFDYLRDNMVYSADERVQRTLSYAVVDEVDSILIDEARTPLIISGQAEDKTDLYLRMNNIPEQLTEQEGEGDNIRKPGDYTLDLKARQVLLTEQGHEKVESILVNMGILQEGRSLYDPANIMLIHHLYAALRAHTLFHIDQHYVVKEDSVVIVDEFTGRLMDGRRWSEGLHQAVEAKEGVPIQSENQTLATITFQNYFRMYQKLSGMTGTADTEAFEFNAIYHLETVLIPTNRPMVRKDENDRVYRTAKAKWNAVIEDIKDCVERGQPTLVGTTSIEVNEFLSQMLKKNKIKHQLLNAKHHEHEAEIVAQAGQAGMVTIATNMAGRGTDIVLGGNPNGEIEKIRQNPQLNEEQKQEKIKNLQAEWAQRHQQIVDKGGLHIIGTERHESRRIDNQLRGRSGRQGDPGSTRFYLSLEDPLLKIFAGERLNMLMQRLKMPDDEAIEHRMVTRSLESAQRKVEQRNFDIRKQLLEYDDVANDQRKVIYQQRNELLKNEDISDTIANMREGVIADTFRLYVPENSIEEQWEIDQLEKLLAEEFALNLPLQTWVKEQEDLDDRALLERIQSAAKSAYDSKVAKVDAISWHQFERAIMLQELDNNWRGHLSALDQLRQGIHLRGYAQKDPKQEYKREAFSLFEELLNGIARSVMRLLMMVQVEEPKQLEEVEPSTGVENLEYHHESLDREDKKQPEKRSGVKVGRNDLCPCGSGKKYKFCHGQLK